MTSRRPTRLFDRTAEKIVPAEILNEISRDELIDVHLNWQPARLLALTNLRNQGKPFPENWHWDWGKKADNLNFLAYRCFAVECEDRVQGLMMISTIGWRGRIDAQAGKPVLYIEYIESAPWNLAVLVESPRFSGVGVVLMQAAIQVSADEGFAGRIALHSLPQSQPFYRSYMADLGIDPAHPEKLCYFLRNNAQNGVRREPFLTPLAVRAAPFALRNDRRSSESICSKETIMNDYSMSDDMFRQRALEEDGCMIAAVGADLTKAMSSSGVNISLTEDHRRFVEGKIQEGQFRSVNDLFEEALRVLENHDALKIVQVRELRARISDSMAAVERVEHVDGRKFVENLISRLQGSAPSRKAG